MCTHAAGRPRALIIDGLWPDPTRDAGSLEAINLALWLEELGYEVIFTGDTEFYSNSPKMAVLERLGIVSLDSAQASSVEQFIEAAGSSLDLVLLSRVYSGGRHFETVYRSCSGARIIFNPVDLHHIREEREARLRGDRSAIVLAAETRERELYLVRQADATIVLSQFEAAELARDVPGALVSVMPPCRDVVAENPPGFAERSGIGFVGGFGHSPNVDAIQFFLREIWPLANELLPGCRFEIAGNDLPDSIECSLPGGVTYLGQIADLTAWLRGLRLTVAPLRYGAGTKGKIASSLAHGVPAVVTEVAAEGMELRPGGEVAITSDPRAFAYAMQRLYSDADLWTRMSSCCLDFARRTLSGEVGKQRLAGLLETLGLPAEKTRDSADPANPIGILVS